MDYLIETKRLGLRKLTQEDVAPLYEILSDAEVMQYYLAPYTLDGVKDWIGRSMDSYQKNGFGLWAVILKESNDFIGQCGISLQNIDGAYVPEIGYHVHKLYWNQGYATEAAEASLAYGFQNFGFESIFIHTYVKNSPAQRIAEKIGMKKTKEYDKHFSTHNLIWRLVVYEIIKKESMSA
ncbi:GNAT family N-acetyltransferase [Ulvibacterium sp.]|uniref:GNAT family N-acetyltransferase n=1 Tax=Ulvibacterium sp. TaxID=2665914 RepID=UPI003BACBF8F